MPDYLQTLLTLGNRFQGVSLDYRRDGTGWPACWRARLVSTKGRPDYCEPCYGATAQQAIDSLEAMVRALDSDPAPATIAEILASSNI
jgi:hypothetical protein